MDRSLLHPALYCGFIAGYSLDLLDKSFSLRVEVLRDEGLSLYDVRFATVSHWSFTAERANPWERIEITDLEIEQGPEASPSEEWHLWFNFWDTAELRVRCGSVLIDDDRLI